MAKYRKKPVEIEAVDAESIFTAAEHNWSLMPKWIEEAYDRGDVLFLTGPRRIEIKTLEGTMTAAMDDWIIRGVKGEIYPCKPDIFAATYDLVQSGGEISYSESA